MWVERETACVRRVTGSVGEHARVHTTAAYIMAPISWEVEVDDVREHREVEPTRSELGCHDDASSAPISQILHERRARVFSIVP